MDYIQISKQFGSFSFPIPCQLIHHEMEIYVKQKKVATSSIDYAESSAKR